MLRNPFLLLIRHSLTPRGASNSGSSSDAPAGEGTPSRDGYAYGVAAAFSFNSSNTA